MNIRNPKWLEDGMIYCEVEYPEVGWVPYHASPDDSGAQQIYARILNGEAGEIAPADPPPPELTPEELLQMDRERLMPSNLQGLLAMEAAGVLDAVEAAIALADRKTQIAFAKASYFRRLSPMVLSMQSVLGWTDEWTDDLFRAAMEIEA